MGAIAVLSYVLQGKQVKREDSRKVNLVKITFGDGAATYPSNGVPISGAKLGCPTTIDSLKIVDDGSTGYKFGYDSTHKSIRMFQSPGVVAHAHPLLLKDSAVVDGATTRVNAGTNLLGANTGGSLTVAGAGANGGVQNSTATADAALNELATSATPALQTLIVEVIGY